MTRSTANTCARWGCPVETNSRRIYYDKDGNLYYPPNELEGVVATLAQEVARLAREVAALQTQANKSAQIVTVLALNHPDLDIPEPRYVAHVHPTRPIEP